MLTQSKRSRSKVHVTQGRLKAGPLSVGRTGSSVQLGSQMLLVGIRPTVGKQLLPHGYRKVRRGASMGGPKNPYCALVFPITLDGGSQGLMVTYALWQVARRPNAVKAG